MAVLDRICRNYKHIVTLHFRSISLTTVSFSDAYNSTENVYGQYGIKIAFGSGESLMMSNEKEQQFNQVDESCRWEIDGGEVNQLHSTGSPFPSNHIGVYYVKSFSNNSLLVCGVAMLKIDQHVLLLQQHPDGIPRMKLDTYF
ncbi:MAG: hypothetical protein ABL887_09410 [Nitrosomonas sp.]